MSYSRAYFVNAVLLTTCQCSKLNIKKKEKSGDRKCIYRKQAGKTQQLIHESDVILKHFNILFKCCEIKKAQGERAEKGWTVETEAVKGSDKEREDR